MDGGGAALGEALGGVGGWGETSPGSAGHESASMIAGAIRTGTGPFSGRFQAVVAALFAATGLPDWGGVPAPAGTAAGESATEAIVHTSNPIGRRRSPTERLRATGMTAAAAGSISGTAYTDGAIGAEGFRVPNIAARAIGSGRRG